MKSQKSRAGLLIFLCWLVYSVSYLGKVNYSANITSIIDFYHVTKAQAGIAPTFFFFAYGIGQVINGLFCKNYNIKWMVFGSLIISAVINFIIGISSNFDIIKWLWMLNGIALAILWPSIIRLLSETLPQKDLGRATLAMGTTVASGTLVVYGLSSLYNFFNNFKLAFYTSTFMGTLVAVFWLLSYNKSVKMAKSERSEEFEKYESNINVADKKEQTTSEKKIFYILICALCFCAVGVNLIKDGLTTWLPAILKEEYSLTDSLSILLTLFLPVVAIFGNLFAQQVHKKIPDYVTHCSVKFFAILVCIGVIIASISLKQIVITLAGLMAASFLASSLNSLLTGVFPMFMRTKLNSGLYAGVLNGFCYVGSTISSYGLGSIADNFGWNAVFFTLMGFCALCCIIWCGYIAAKHILQKRTA